MGLVVGKAKQKQFSPSKACDDPSSSNLLRSVTWNNGFGYCLSSVYLHYLAARPFLPKKKQQKDNLINLKIQKENPKVVNEITIEDLCLTKAANCRCWRSKTFPACDGSHDKHNKLTGDNVGPLILKKYNSNELGWNSILCCKIL
uniref:CDGSH iron-sulfur domain-containing protein 2 n=1 Tax=Monodon monoceros TaxID=40151 RepID=A0A8C6B521_MONMO